MSGTLSTYFIIFLGNTSRQPCHLELNLIFICRYDNWLKGKDLGYHPEDDPKAGDMSNFGKYTLPLDGGGISCWSEKKNYKREKGGKGKMIAQ